MAIFITEDFPVLLRPKTKEIDDDRDLNLFYLSIKEIFSRTFS